MNKTEEDYKVNGKKISFIRKEIIAVRDATFAVAKTKPEENSGFYGVRILCKESVLHFLRFVLVYMEV